MDSFVAQVEADPTEYRQTLRELLETSPTHQISQVTTSRQRVELTVIALTANAGIKDLNTKIPLKILRRLIESERRAALQLLDDKQLLLKLLIDGWENSEQKSLITLDDTVWDNLLSKLDASGLSDLLALLSVDQIRQVPKAQINGLQLHDVLNSVYKAQSPGRGNALLARLPRGLLTSVVSQLDSTFLQSLDKSVLDQLDEEALISLLQKFSGKNFQLEQLLNQVSEQRRQDLPVDRRRTIARGGSAEVQNLLGLNSVTLTETSPAVTTRIPPEPTDQQPSIKQLVQQFKGSDNRKRDESLKALREHNDFYEVIEYLCKNNEHDLLKKLPDARVGELEVKQLTSCLEAASPAVGCALLEKLESQRRVDTILAMDDQKLKPLLNLDPPPLGSGDVVWLMKDAARFARLLDLMPEEKLLSLKDQLKLTEDQITSLPDRSEKLTRIFRPVPRVTTEKTPEGKTVTYVELPPRTTLLGESKETFLAKLPSEKGQPINSLKLHGVGRHSNDGPRDGGLKVTWTEKSKRNPLGPSKPLELHVNCETGMAGNESQPLCTFRVEESGEVKFKWDCQERSELTPAIGVLHRSVLEITRVGADSLFLSFLEPITIPRRQNFDLSLQVPTKPNEVYWKIPKFNLSHSTLLLHDLTLHLPEPPATYSPENDDLRELQRKLTALPDKYGQATIEVQQMLGGDGESVVALKIIPRRPTKEDQDLLKKLTAKRKEFYGIPSEPFDNPARIDAGLAIANLLGMPRPKDEGGKDDLRIDSPDFKSWTGNVLSRANEFFPSDRPIAVPIRDRNELLKSGLTISGSIYRVVGHNREKSNSGKIEGGVIVKMIEIRDQE